MGFFTRSKPSPASQAAAPDALADGFETDDDPIASLRGGAEGSGVGHPGGVAASLMVAVRSRPLLMEEQLRGVRKDILRVMDEKMIVVLDPDDCGDQRSGSARAGVSGTSSSRRSKERRYTFDKAFGKKATNRDVYEATARRLIRGVLSGHNGTVFAYGATGSGKTYTMVGERNDPGMMLLSLADIFAEIERTRDAFEYEVTCSYLEVYNELIYDLLVAVPEGASTGTPLELRDNGGGQGQGGACVVGLSRVEVRDPDTVMDLLREGNLRRKTEPTEANATSSRSHAVLEINVARKDRARGYKSETLTGKLALVDLAGSERASETLNVGHKLRDGANINRSLLALANCINALGKKNAGQGVYVPFRNSKLTRLLKDGLSGNSRTAMVANVSCGGDQYAHTINTLKYADRAKEIKTHVVQNLQTVESHIGEYQRLIDTLQGEVASLKARLREQDRNRSGSGRARTTTREATREGPGGNPGVDEKKKGSATTEKEERDRDPHGEKVSAEKRATNKPARPPAAPAAPRSSAPVVSLPWLEELCEELRENGEARVDTQRALFEHEDSNVQNKCELQALDARLVSELRQDPNRWGAGGKEADALRERRVALCRAIAENEAACLRYRTEIDVVERANRETERAKLEPSTSSQAASTNRNDTNGGQNQTVNVLSAKVARFLRRARDAEVRLDEAAFQLDVREGVIEDQREIIAAMWRVFDALGEATRAREGKTESTSDEKNAADAVRSRADVLALARRFGVVAPYSVGGDQGGIVAAGVGHASTSGGSTKPGSSSVAGQDLGDPVEMTTVVGARARARFDFWENFELVTGASRYRGDAAPVTPHGSRPPQHENKIARDGGTSSHAAANVAKGASSGLIAPKKSSSQQHATSAAPGISAGSSGAVSGLAARPPSSSSQGSRGSSGRRDSGSDAGSSSARGRQRSAVYTRVAAVVGGGDSAAAKAATAQHPSASEAARIRVASAQRHSARRRAKAHAGPPAAASAVHRAGAGLPSLGVSGSVAPRSPRLSVASYAETSAQRLKALQMLRERHARVVEESERAAESDKAARSSIGGGTLGGGGTMGSPRASERVVTPDAYVVAR